VPLLVMPAHPETVEEARSHVWTWIGACCLAIGARVFYFVITTWPVGPMTWIVGGIVVAHFGVKLYRTIIQGKRSGVFNREAAMVNIPLQRSRSF
jgi:hypothetical protein